MSQRQFLTTIRGNVRAHLVTGILVIVPVGVTFLILKFLFQSVDGILAPVIRRLLGFHVPGLGLILTLLLVYLTGLVSGNLLGRRVIHLGERLLVRMPLVKGIYTASKQIVSSMAAGGRMSFKRVVIVDYPRLGTKSMGFVTGETHPAPGDPPLLTVFLPSTPNPTTGWVILLPAEEVTETGLSVEEGIKFIISGGLLSPENLDARPPMAARLPGAPIGH